MSYQVNVSDHIKKTLSFFRRELPLFFLLSASLLVRIIFSSMRKMTPPGDAFNYMFIARLLLHSTYPGTEKRQILYPLLILLGTPFFDPYRLEVAISVISSIGSILVLFLLCRRWRLSRLSSYLAASFLSFSFVFIETSMLPISDSLFVLLLLLSVYFLEGSGRRDEILSGISLGLMCMTRLEGFPIAFVLLAYKACRSGLKSAVLPLTFFLIYVSPQIILNLKTFGVPVHFGYEEDEGLNYLLSLDDFIENVNVYLFNISRLYGYFDLRLFLRMIEKANYLSRLQLLGATLSVFFAIVGLMVFTFMRDRPTPILLIPFTHFCIALLIKISATHYSTVIPFVSVFLAMGVCSPTKLVSVKASEISLLKYLTYIFTIMCSTLIIYSSLSVMSERTIALKSNSYTRVTFYDAVIYLRDKTKGRVGFTQGYIMPNYYLGSRNFEPYRGAYYEPDVEFYEKTPIKQPTIDEQKNFILEENLSYLVASSIDRINFTIISDPQYRDIFELDKNFTHSYIRDGDIVGTEITWVYRIRNISWFTI